MPGAYKACPRCNTPAPIDASFCGQCGRQYRTQFIAAPPVPQIAVADTPMSPYVGPTVLQRTIKLLLAIGAAVAIAAVILYGVDAYKRQASQAPPNSASSGTAQSMNKTAPIAVAPPSDTASAAKSAPTQEAGVDAAARAAVERENQRLNLAPPAGSVDQNGMIHLRGGGVISQKQWDEASRKLETSPVFHSPPPPPPF